jgi:hypothetical protein
VRVPIPEIALALTQGWNTKSEGLLYSSSPVIPQFLDSMNRVERDLMRKRTRQVSIDPKNSSQVGIRLSFGGF